MSRRFFITALILSAVLSAINANAQPPTRPVGLLEQVSSGTTTGRSLFVGGKPHRVVARISETAEATIFGTDVACGNDCEASAGTILGTITTDGDSIVVSGFPYIYALVTSWTAGTIRADISPEEGVISFKTGTCADDGDVDTIETICTIPLEGRSEVSIQGTVATSAFTDFNTDISNDGGTTYSTIGDISNDYAVPNGHIFGCDASPTTWSTTAITCKFDGLAGYSHIRFQAAGTNSNPAITWRIQ